MRGRSKTVRHDAGTLRVPGGTVSISDGAFFWDFPVEIELQGVNDLTARCTIVDDIVQEVRLAPDASGLYQVGAPYELRLEFSLVLVCDRNAWDAWLGSLSVEEYLSFQSSLEEKWMVDRVPLVDGPDALVFRAAADSYEVRRLLDSNARTVGCAITAGR